MHRLPQSAPPDGTQTNSNSRGHGHGHGHSNGHGHGNGNGTSEVDLSMLNPGERAMAWHNQGKATAMLRTSSDGADVSLEENGIEWEVIEGHGTGKGRPSTMSRSARIKRGCASGSRTGGKIERRHSLEPPETYAYVRRALP